MPLRLSLPVFIVLFASLMPFGILQGQVVNVEAMRERTGDEAGSHGMLDGSFYLGGTQNILLRLNTAANIRHSEGKDSYYGIFSSNFSTRLGGDNLVFEQNGFVHGRYNRIIDEEWTAEVFFQWQSNIPMRIAQRYNVGLGPRYMAVDSEGLKFFISPLVMYELDVDYVTGAYESAFRMSTYLSMNQVIAGKYHWNTIAYYQPKFGKWDDLRTIIDTRFSTPLSPDLNLVIRGSLRYDSYPSGTDVPQFTFGTTTGLSYRF